MIARACVLTLCFAQTVVAQTSDGVAAHFEFPDGQGDAVRQESLFAPAQKTKPWTASEREHVLQRFRDVRRNAPVFGSRSN